MKYYLVKLLTNSAGVDAPSIIAYSGDNAEQNARVAYHNTLAAYHYAEDVLYAVCEILNEDGDSIIKEIVDHRPEPEPPEPPEPEEETATEP